ncbi:MAG TPA: AAA family ATPase [Chitinophagales bacterium]|nr:AAA family ATPase [Chitinophagales bacterium]
MEQAEKVIKPVIIISGPVGAGKTTVAKKLVEITPAPVSYIEGDKFWFFIAKGFEENARVRNFRMVMASMTAAVVPYALYGYQVVLDFSMTPSFLEKAAQIFNSRNIPFHYIVLRPSEEVCKARAAARNEGIVTDYEPYKRLYDAFDKAAQYTISDDNAGAAAMATRIRAEVDAGNYLCKI